MVSIRAPDERDMESLRRLAHTIWQATYTALISQAQIDFMLADRYAAERMLAERHQPDHAWRVACLDDAMIGFAHARLETDSYKLDKLYIHPEYQRRGIGRLLLDNIQIFARDHAATRLCLQVNRGNAAAIAAYQQYGFTICGAHVFDIGGGFVMDDYVMEVPL